MKKILKKIFSINRENNHIVVRLIGLKLSFRVDKIHYIRQSNKVHLPYIETHLVDHCNLNCHGCTHFCPITPETFIDIEKFKKDIFELAKKSDITVIRLMGGEPLLHPDICKFIEVTRQAFPKSNIALLSNGILLKTMPFEFWEALRRNQVIMELTHYPIVKDFDSYLELVKINNVKLGDIHIVDDFSLMLNSHGNSDIKSTFNKCPNKSCVNFKDGRLVACPIACYIHRYNDYFNRSIPSEEGIEVSSNSAENIFKYLKTPIKTCSYCVKSSNMKYIPWGVSKKEADEWFAL